MNEMMIIDKLKEKTENFEKGFHSETLMGWWPKFDDNGRPMNADPNYRTGSVDLCGKTYTFVRKAWKVKVWERKASYTEFRNTEGDFIAEIDLTPHYLKSPPDSLN